MEYAARDAGAQGCWSAAGRGGAPLYIKEAKKPPAAGRHVTAAVAARACANRLALLGPICCPGPTPARAQVHNVKTMVAYKQAEDML